MSDHVDGPRQISDPAVDLTDLFAFTSPANPARMVLAADAFPSAGAGAVFSNAAFYAIAVRRASVAGLGDAAKFATGEEEFRFVFRFDVLTPGPDGTPVQRGTCTMPGGQQLGFVVGDTNGATSADGVFRVFAGLRSDPFLLAWTVREKALNKVPNLLQHDNVLTFLVEFDTARVLDPAKGTLFAAIAETYPVPGPPALVINPPRYDWLGRSEQTNMRLDNPAVAGSADLRDLWNQQTPFALAAEYEPVFRQRLADSLADYASRGGTGHWTPAGIAANVEVFLDDFLLFDISRPISNTSFFEIEKSTIDGTPYATGGGRTIEAHDFDTLLTWLVNHDQGDFMQGGAASATRPMQPGFPYFAEPNTALQTVVASVDVAATPDEVWALIGAFGGMWHPLMARIDLIGTGIGQLRVIYTIDGKTIIERLDAIDPVQRSYSYTMISGLPAADYTGTLDVKPQGTGSSVEWRIQYWADGQPDILVRTIITSLEKAGLDALKKRFG